MGAAVGGGEYAITAGETFIWKSARAEVSLSTSPDGWVVQHSTIGRLLGPPHVVHQARHRDARLATWDVMARVQNVTNSEAEMVRTGNIVVQWINAHPLVGV